MYTSVKRAVFNFFFKSTLDLRGYECSRAGMTPWSGGLGSYLVAPPSLEGHPRPHGPRRLPNTMSVISASWKGTVRGRTLPIPCEGQDPEVGPGDM